MIVVLRHQEIYLDIISDTEIKAIQQHTAEDEDRSGKVVRSAQEKKKIGGDVGGRFVRVCMYEK